MPSGGDENQGIYFMWPYAREIDAPTPDWAVNFPCVIQND